MKVYAFKISDLDRVYKAGSKDLEKASSLLKTQFQRWSKRDSESLELDDATLARIIQEDAAANDMVDWADKLGATLTASKLTASQIRNIFGEVKSIQQRGIGDARMLHRFILLKPKIQYAAARAKTKGMDGLRDVLTTAIQKVDNNPDHFQRFVEFFEAILAYHKVYEGKLS